MGEEKALTVVSPPTEQTGLMAMATLTDVDFAERLAQLKKGTDRIRQIKRELMKEDAHYGNLPGIDKPALLKPGAELLCSIYSLRPDFVPEVRYGDGETAPHVSVTMRCELHLGDLDGPVVAVGYGAANSWERKHRYRTAERSCPSCGTEGTVRRSGYPNKAGPHKGEKGWWCRACKTNWDDPKEPQILEQQTGMVENRDPYDLLNTLVKMAKKRAHVDAALTGTASSDLFTQDVEEDQPASEPAAPAEAEEDKAPKKRAKARGAGKAGDIAKDGLKCPHCQSENIAETEDGHAFCADCRKGI